MPAEFEQAAITALISAPTAIPAGARQLHGPRETAEGEIMGVSPTSSADRSKACNSPGTKACLKRMVPDSPPPWVIFF